MSVMQQKGQQLPEGTLNTICRAGGWQAATGVTTLLRVYARKVLDEHIDMYSLSLGYEVGESGWAQRLKSYLGDPVFPPEGHIDIGRSQVPMQVRFYAWYSPEWQKFQHSMNAMCADVMVLAKADTTIMQMHRYCQERRAFTMYLKKYRSSSLVQNYVTGCKMRVTLWKAVLKKALQDCLSSFVQACPVDKAELYFRSRQYLQFLKVMHIGNTTCDMTGCVVSHDLLQIMDHIQHRNFSWK